MNYRSQEQLSVGDHVGNFRIIAGLGQGGMGSVYLAEDQSLSRKVALKVILPELARDPSFQRRFESEARNAAAIDHPNVVPIYSFGATDGHLFLAMRYIEGSDLQGYLERAASNALDPAEAISILSPIAEALDAAHGKGLVHRDVKPANILIEGEGTSRRVFLTDFGLTRPHGSKGETETGHWVGTLDYAAPEQMQSGWVDARTDVYALGCVLYRMLAGAVPHPTTGPAKVMSIVQDPIPPVAGVGSVLNSAISRATAKEPEDRFPSAGDLAAAASAALQGGATTQPMERSVAVGMAATGLSEADSSEKDTRAIPQVSAPTMIRPTGSPSTSTRKRLAMALGGLALVAAGVAIAFALANGDDGSDPTIRTVTQTTDTTIVEESEAPESEGAEVSKGPINGQGEPLTLYTGVAYSIDVPMHWIHDEEDELSEEGFYTNRWRDPTDPDNTYVRSDGGNPARVSDPVAISEGLVEQVRQAEGYYEYSYGPEMLEGRETARWVYELEGDTRVDYFFVECGKGLAVVGSTSAERFESLAPTYRAIASSAKVYCE